MGTATIRQCAVLVGGLGTRLGALTANAPKPLLPCGDRPFLGWLLREFIRFGVESLLVIRYGPQIIHELNFIMRRHVIAASAVLAIVFAALAFYMIRKSRRRKSVLEA